MIRLSLRHRLLALALLPAAILAIVLVAYFTYSGMKALDAELRQRGMAVVRYLAPVSEYGVIAGSMESLQALAQTTVQQPGIKAAIVINREGRTLAVSGRVSLSSEQLRTAPEAPGIVAEEPHWLAFGAPIQRTLADPDVLFDPAGSKSTAETIGRIFVELDKTEVTNQQQALFNRGLAIIGFGLLVVALLAIAMADSLTRPVERLVKAVRAVSRGDLESRVPATSTAEFGELERGFNEMAEHMAKAHQTMQERVEEATAQLAFQARHDPLTGLINRREFEVRLERAIAAAQAGGLESTLLFIDLDRFKPVNDTCGHLAGDELLRQISRLLQGRLRDEDTLARVGGDEFAVLLHNCTGNRAVQVAEGFCTLAAAYRFIWQDKIFSIGASIGLATIGRHTHNVAEALAAGDSACYAAKEQGRNRVQVHKAKEPHNRRQMEHPWHDRITKALEEGRLIYDARPLQRLAGAASAGHFVEIGARLDDRSAPGVPMSVLLDAADRYDLAPTIDRHVIEAAAAGLARARDHARPLRCLVPLSAASIRDRNTVSVIADILGRHSLPGASLFLQLDEASAVQHATQTMELCSAARELGCGIVLGEFGGGFASFSHLHSIRPGCVKINHSLTRDISSSRSALALIRAIQEVTNDLDIETAAEGVDDISTATLFEELGITYIQGRLVAPVEPFESWLEGAVIRGG